MKAGYFLSHPQGEACPTASGFSRCALHTQHMWKWYASPPKMLAK